MIMKTKNIFKYTVVLVILLLISGCEDFLDNPIEGVVPRDEVDYSDESRMYEPVSGVYARARQNSLAHWANQCMLNFRSDFIFKAGHANDQPIMEDIQDFKYETMTNAWFVNNLWTQHFGIIRDANAALEELELFGEQVSNQALNLQYKGEVRFFRALAYWRMLRFYGDVPFYDKNLIAANLRLSPRNEVYNYVVAELNEIVNHLSAQHPNQMERKGAVTKWAAYTLLAKIAADFQDYETMLTATKAVYDSGLFSLHPDFYSLFKYQGKLSDESILELQHTDFGQSTGSVTGIDQFFVAHGIKQQGGTKYDGTGFTSGWGFSMPAQKYVDLFIERGEGIRFETSIIYPNTRTLEGDSIGRIPNDLQALLDRYNIVEGRGVAEAYFFKTYVPYITQTPGRHRYGGYNNIHIFRYADLLLMYAEALIHNNGPGAGDIPLNLVRARAEMPPLSGATIDDIIDERAVELEFEWGADRFFDLVRLDKAQGTIPSFVKGEHEYFPIPVAQLDLQPGLEEPPVPGIIPPKF
jgi:starch-binding outer membrane protein, SusD/RagB family